MVEAIDGLSEGKNYVIVGSSFPKSNGTMMLRE
jgi:hypothetical protein